jgi:phenylpropionate dioxygenase-like ring-hydroxylating dioxygenase large terminal subunit
MNEIAHRPGAPAALRDLIPAAEYISPDFLKLEKARLWPRVWQMACREEEIPKAGDFYTYGIADESIAVVRLESGEIAAYFNVCPHRGRRLTSGCGRMGKFHCKFHGWQWSLDGRPLEVVDREDWAGALQDEDVTLQRVRVGVWGGWVFVNMDPKAEPLEDFLAPVRPILDPFEFDKMRYRWRRQVVMPANWKVALEAFNEGYHVQTTHRQLITTFEDQTFSRAHGPHGMFGYEPTRIFGRPSSRIADAETQATASIRDGWCGFMVEVWETLDASWTAAAVWAAKRMKATLPVDASLEEVFGTFAQFHREEHEKTGAPWPTITTEQMMAAGADWHIFPNMVFLPQATNLLGYRARPNGDDPDSCIFEVYVLERFAPGAEPKVEVEVGDWASLDWGLILAQDFQNMAEIQQGMKSRGFRGARPNPVQEQAISNMHAELRRYLGLED